MPPMGDRAAMEADMLNQEILRLDMQTKERIMGISGSIRDEKGLFEETRSTKALITSLRLKIENLEALVARLLTVKAKNEVKAQCGKHRSEMSENTKELTKAIQKARKEIYESARLSLLSGGRDEIERRKLLHDQNTLKESAMKTTEKISELVAKMNERVTQSEKAMDVLISSSGVLADTHSEFNAQYAHIQTSNKLLSKYERRELTDKILLFLAFILYMTVIYYILQKRVAFKFWLF